MCIDNESLHSVDNSIRSEYSQDKEYLERSQLSIAFWKFFKLRSFEIKPFFPNCLIFLKIFNKMFVGVSNSDKFLKVFPTLIIYPFVWFGFLDF